MELSTTTIAERAQVRIDNTRKSISLNSDQKKLISFESFKLELEKLGLQ